MHSVYLLTGSNQGVREAQLARCIRELNNQAGKVVAQSQMYETEAWGNENLPSHLNQALLLHTSLSPLQLLITIHQIEARLGRIRKDKWGIRSIDIDIIYFDDIILNLPELTIPHPLMQHRNFVLLPLAQIAADFCHPVLGKTTVELLQSCSDELKAEPIMTLLTVL